MYQFDRFGTITTVFAFLSVIAPIATSQSTGSAGTIEGVALDSSGKPSPETLVFAIRMSPNRWTSRPVLTTTVGAFALSGLAPGDYVLCAAADPARLQVDPCFWLAPIQKLMTLGAGQRMAGQTVQLLQGRKISVRIQDQQGLLNSAEQAAIPQGGRARALKVELTGPPEGLQRDLSQVRTEAGGVRIFEILAPSGPLTRLRVQVQGLTLLDAQQRALPNNRIDLAVGQGSTQADFAFRVGAN